MPRLPAFIVAPASVRVARMAGVRPKRRHASDRHGGGEGKDAPVQPEIDEQRTVAGAEERDQRSAEPLRDDHPGGRADRRDQQTLRQHLPDDAAAGRADREPDRHLALTRRRAREHQVREIRARDEEHQRRHAEQDVQRVAVVAAQPEIPPDAARAPISISR